MVIFGFDTSLLLAWPVLRTLLWFPVASSASVPFLCGVHGLKFWLYVFIIVLKMDQTLSS